MKIIQEIISKAIEEKHELKLLEDFDTNQQKFIVNDDEFLDYVKLVSSLLNYSELVLSGKDYLRFYPNFEKCDFTKNEFFQYLTLIGQIWKVLDENVSDKEVVSDIFFFLEDDFEDFMSGIRKKIYELKFDQTDVWKELEKKLKSWQDHFSSYNQK